MQSIRNYRQLFISVLNLLERFRSLVRPQYRYLIVRVPATSPPPKFHYGQKVKCCDFDSLTKEGVIAFVHPLTGDEHFYRGDAYEYGVRYRTRDGIDVQSFSESTIARWNREEF